VQMMHSYQSQVEKDEQPWPGRMPVLKQTLVSFADLRLLFYRSDFPGATRYERRLTVFYSFVTSSDCFL
jgi:hypothetical protein